MSILLDQHNKSKLTSYRLKEAKLSTLYDAIEIKQKYTNENQQKIINDIAIKIQHKRNNGNFSLDDLESAVCELMKASISLEGTHKLLEHLIILSKHSSVIGIAISNWFSAYKTNSINNFISLKIPKSDYIIYSNINLDEFITLENQAAIHMCIGNAYQDISSYKSALNIYEELAKKIELINSNYPKFHEFYNPAEIYVSVCREALTSLNNNIALNQIIQIHKVKNKNLL